MIRRIIGYVPSTVVPAVVSFSMIYIYTRLLTPSVFGEFTFVFSAVLFIQNSIFTAIPVAVMQLYPDALAARRRPQFLAECILLFVILSAGFATVAAIAGILPSGHIAKLMSVGVLLTVARSGVSLSQAIRRMDDRAVMYNSIECFHAIGGLSLGLLLIYLQGPSATSVLGGLLGASFLCLITALPDMASIYRGFGAISRPEIRKLVAFAVPLVVVDLMVCVLQLSDRFLLGAMGGEVALGIYAVAFNLVDRPTSLVCSAITTATYPMAVHAMQDGTNAGRLQMGRNGAALLALAIPACVGLWLTKGSLVQILVGPEFRSGAEALIPIMCVAALIRGFSTHFVDHAFQLARRTSRALWVYAPAGVLTVILNVLLIPRFGAHGAAWAALICQSFALVLGWVVARGVFPIWVPAGDVAKIMMAVLPMAALLIAASFPASWFGLLAAVGTGAAVFGASAVALNVGGSRIEAGLLIGGLMRRASPSR